MRYLILSLTLVACASYRTPPTPAAFWIWPTLEEARLWQRENPNMRLCITQVPDGYATEGC